MIRIGLAGWGDHGQLYGPGVKAAERLKVYSEHFSFVEVDSSYYAIPKPEQFAKWCSDTPEDFRFLIKAYQGMTGHLRGPNPYQDADMMFRAFLEAIEPVREAGKLSAVLFQFPPWFDCSKANVALLRKIKERIGDLPVALEFRHQSWFAGDMLEKTIDFMVKEGWIHSICDEPDAGPGSIPAVLRPTDSQWTVVRFHGRNAEGWNGNGRPDWRVVRYLYRYSMEELAEWKHKLVKLQEQTEQIVVVFNNNSGGDAADNAKQLMQLLGMKVKAAPPSQLELF